MNLCPPELTLERFVAGALPPADSTRIDDHVNDCETCRSWLAAALADEDLLDGVRRLDSISMISEPTPERIAGYRILEEIGAGGMGVVYSAEQENPRRRVALKVIRPGLATGRTLRRFEHEANALGRLRHPGIAQIFEAGTFPFGDGTRPFFAMEFIDGVPLREYVEKHDLPLEARLDLFAAVCDAVHHAHAKGVLHRDLKPANILVDEGGAPKVLDFGVARCNDQRVETDVASAEEDRTHDGHTLAGNLIGTLGYMSPEQVGADPHGIDTRSDVHALGVILYEILTGTMPYELSGKSTADAVRILTEVEPVPLATRDASLHGDLAMIVDKALSKDVADRYGSAAEVAAELRRFNRLEPIHARPPSAAYQMRKFAQRNRALVGGIVGIFLVMIAGVVASLILWRQAEDAANLARREAAEAESAREFMQEVLSLASPRQRKNGKVPTLREALHIALERVDDIKGKPWVEASVRHTLGRVLGDLEEFEPATEQLHRSLALYKKIFGPRHKKVAYVLTSLASVLFRMEKYDAARLATAEALSMRDVLAQKNVVILGTALSNAGIAAYFDNRFDEARRWLEQSIAAYEQHGGPDGIDAAITRSSLATVLAVMGQDAQAESLYRRSIRVQRQVLGDQHSRLIVPLQKLVSLLLKLDRLDEGQELQREALVISKVNFPDEHATVARAESILGGILCRRGDTKAGLPMVRSAVAKLRKSFGRNHGRFAEGLERLGSALLTTEHDDEQALSSFENAIAIATKALGATHILTLRAMAGRGEALLRTERVPEAQKVLRNCGELLAEHAPWARHLRERVTRGLEAPNRRDR
jgi:eukaryotic-like serine/threonine-protein kinase